MARGNRPARVSIFVRMPEELDLAIKSIAFMHRFSSRNAAIVYLLESHPEVLTWVREFCYTGPQEDTQSQGG